MKTLKLLTAGMLAVASLHVASATTVKITGSTAYRKALYNAAIAQLSGGASPVKVAYVASAAGLGSANQATFTNGTDTIQCCMAGSVGGINWVVNDLPAATDAARTLTAEAWIAVPANYATTWSAPTVGAAPGYALGGGDYLGTQGGVPSSTWEAASKADVTMSDSYQDSTAYNSGVTGISLDDANGDSVGVVAFVFAKGSATGSVPSASYNRLTNVTPLAFQYLAANGFAKLSLLTGNSADSAYDVVLIGRDNDSGTRLAVNFETAYGNVDTPMSQWLAKDASNKDVGTDSTAGAIQTLTPSNGTAGYSSGGNVKSVMLASISATAKRANRFFIPVGYLSTADGAGTAILYNGVTESDAVVQSGQYTFWTNEHMYYKDSLVGTGLDTIADSLAGLIHDTYATAAGGVLNGTMLSSRQGEGQVVNPN